MQTIITKFLGATNSRGARIKAKSWNGSVTVGYDYALNGPDNHEAAAKALIAEIESKADVKREIVAQGDLPCGTGDAFIIR